MEVTSGERSNRCLRIWLPAVRAGSGADVFTTRLEEALKRVGHTPILQWFDHSYELFPQALKRVAAPSNIDIVHAGSWQGFAFKRKGVPLIVTEHHYVLDPAFRAYKTFAQHIYHRSLIGPYMRHSFAEADAIVTDSMFTTRVLAGLLGIKAARTIPLWADYKMFSPANAHVRTNGRFRLLFVGNASKRKGADVIPALAPRLGSDFEIRCTAGLRANASLAERANITLLGRLSLGQLIEEYRGCDAVLVPSRYEGFGYSALEAMACGKPVLGFRCGAVDEVVKDGESGLLSDIDDLDALESNCRKLASDRLLAERMGVEGRKRAVSAFSEQAGVDAYVALYRSLVGQPG